MEDLERLNKAVEEYLTWPFLNLVAYTMRLQDRVVELTMDGKEKDDLILELQEQLNGE